MVDAYAAEHLEVITADARAWAERVSNAGCIFVGPHAPVSLGDYCAGSNHVLPTGGTGRHSSGLSVQSFLKGVHLVEYDAAALAEVAPHVLALVGGRGPAGARRGRRASGCRDACWTTCPLRDELRGEQPYGAPQLDVAGAAQRQREPVPARRRGGRRHRGGGRRGRARRSTAIPTATRSRCAPISPRTSTPTAPAGCAAENVWAANGSNEVMLHLLQAFAGPGPHRGVVRADLLDVSGVRARHPLDAGWSGAGPTTSRSTSPRRATVIAEHRPSVVLLASPNNPTGTALPLADIEALLEVAPGMVVVDEAYAEFRRAGTPSALTLLPRHPRLVVTRTMSKAFALAGGRLGYLAAVARRRRRAAHRPAALPPVGGVAGGRPSGARARVRAARRGRRAARRARPHRRLAALDRIAGGRLGRQLRAVRHVRRSARRMAGPARPRRADPGNWSGRLAAGVDRHARRRWHAFRTALEEVRP